jgi:hypothetical protein
MADELVPHDPEVLAPLPSPVWRSKIGYRVVFGIGLVAFLTALLFEFLALRGVVNLFASRIVLAAMGLICCSALLVSMTRRNALIGFLFVGIFMYGLDRFVPKPDTLSLRCRADGVPVGDFPSSSPSTVLIDPQFPFGSINHWLIRSAKGYPPNYVPGSIGRLIYQCELTNTTGTTLFNVNLPTKLLSYPARDHLTENGTGGLACNELDAPSPPKTVIVPVGDMTAGGKFIFYFYNNTTDCASLRFAPPKSSAWMTLRLVATEEELMIFLGPRALK